VAQDLALCQHRGARETDATRSWRRGRATGATAVHAARAPTACTSPRATTTTIAHARATTATTTTATATYSGTSTGTGTGPASGPGSGTGTGPGFASGTGPGPGFASGPGSAYAPASWRCWRATFNSARSARRLRRGDSFPAYR